MQKRAPRFARYLAIFALYLAASILALIAWPMNQIGRLADVAAYLLDVAETLK